MLGFDCFMVVGTNWNSKEGVATITCCRIIIDRGERKAGKKTIIVVGVLEWRRFKQLSKGCEGVWVNHSRIHVL